MKKNILGSITLIIFSILAWIWWRGNQPGTGLGLIAYIPIIIILLFLGCISLIFWLDSMKPTSVPSVGETSKKIITSVIIVIVTIGVIYLGYHLLMVQLGI